MKKSLFICLGLLIMIAIAAYDGLAMDNEMKRLYIINEEERGISSHVYPL